MRISDWSSDVCSSDLTPPRIKPGSASRKIRNGVGLRDPHTLVFAISQEPVTFWEFAQLFRVGLSSRNALFLDGGISSLYAPALRRFDRVYPMGPIIAEIGRASCRERGGELV